MRHDLQLSKYHSLGVYEQKQFQSGFQGCPRGGIATIYTPQISNFISTSIARLDPAKRDDWKMQDSTLIPKNCFPEISGELASFHISFFFFELLGAFAFSFFLFFLPPCGAIVQETNLENSIRSYRPSTFGGKASTGGIGNGMQMPDFVLFGFLGQASVRRPVGLITGLHISTVEGRVIHDTEHSI